MKVALVTGNLGKAREAALLLSGSGIDVERIDPLLAAPPEIQGEVGAIAVDKLEKAISRAADADLVVVEDSALEMDALGGMPGPYIKDFFAAMGCEGLARISRDAGDGLRGATDVCVLACAPPSKPSDVLLFVGKTVGSIVEPAGKEPQGFGWDPVFAPDGGDGKTYAEMSQERKNELSARSKAYVLLTRGIGDGSWLPKS